MEKQQDSDNQFIIAGATFVAGVLLSILVYMWIHAPEEDIKQRVELSNTAKANRPLSDLHNYGKSIVDSMEPGTIELKHVEKTMESPLRTYIVVYHTNHQALMSKPNAETDKVAYLTNVGSSEIWEVKFCQDRLTKIMRHHGIDMVSGQLKNTSGEIQRLASCYAS